MGQLGFGIHKKRSKLQNSKTSMGRSRLNLKREKIVTQAKWRNFTMKNDDLRVNLRFTRVQKSRNGKTDFQKDHFDEDVCKSDNLVSLFQKTMLEGDEKFEESVAFSTLMLALNKNSNTLPPPTCMDKNYKLFPECVSPKIQNVNFTDDEGIITTLPILGADDFELPRIRYNSDSRCGWPKKLDYPIQLQSPEKQCCLETRPKSLLDELKKFNEELKMSKECLEFQENILKDLNQRSEELFGKCVGF